VLDFDSHVFNNEVAGAPVIGQLQDATDEDRARFPVPGAGARGGAWPLPSTWPPTGLVCIENTHNRHGGTCCTPEEIAAVAAVAHEAGVPVAPRRRAALQRRRRAEAPGPAISRAHVDSVTFCVSKGLAAPVGSVICGSADFIDRARPLAQDARLAACGRSASSPPPASSPSSRHGGATGRGPRRTRDGLGEGLAEAAGTACRSRERATNIVIVRVERGPPPTDELVKGCAARKVKVHAMGPAAILCVTHKDVDAEDTSRALEAFRELTSRW